MGKGEDNEQLRDTVLKLSDDDLANVSGGTGPEVGGVTGNYDATVHNGYNTGIVESGPEANDAAVHDCYNKGAVP